MCRIVRNGNKIISFIKRDAKNRAELYQTINFLRNILPDTVIFGGMIREFELNNARSFCSDVDLVTLASSHEIYQAIKTYKPEKNKFGGFRFSSGKWMYDIWSLTDTWAIKEGLCSDENFNSLLSTTFFNLDSAYLHISKNEIITSDAFKNGIHEKILDYNLLYNPAPKKMVRKAIKFAHKYNLPLSKRLVEYITYQNNIYQGLIDNTLHKRMMISLENEDSLFYLEEQLELMF